MFTILLIIIFFKKFKPRSSGVRHKIWPNSFLFLKKFKEKSFCFFPKAQGGRNLQGTITVRHKKQMQKKRAPMLCNPSQLINALSILIGIFRPHASGKHVGIFKYSTGSFASVALANGMLLGTYVYPTNFFSTKLRLSLNATHFFIFYAYNLIFYNVFSTALKKILFAKSAGTYCKFKAWDNDLTRLRIILPSNTIKYISYGHVALIGRNSNIWAKKFVYGKAGLHRFFNIRPTVRGVAMNPVDHPHGGRAKTVQPERTPWGKIAKLNK